MRFSRRVRRVSASSFGISGGISQAFDLPLRPGRPLAALPLAAATLASSSSSAAFALLLPCLPASLSFASSALERGFAAAALAAVLATATGFFASTFVTSFFAGLAFFGAGRLTATAFFLTALILL